MSLVCIYLLQVKMRYGLIDGQQRTLEEIGLAFRVTRERVRQIEARALHKIKQPQRVRKAREEPTPLQSVMHTAAFTIRSEAELLDSAMTGAVSYTPPPPPPAAASPAAPTRRTRRSASSSPDAEALVSAGPSTRRRRSSSRSSSSGMMMGSLEGYVMRSNNATLAG